MQIYGRNWFCLYLKLLANNFTFHGILFSFKFLFLFWLEMSSDSTHVCSKWKFLSEVQDFWLKHCMAKNRSWLRNMLPNKMKNYFQIQPDLCHITYWAWLKATVRAKQLCSYFACSQKLRGSYGRTTMTWKFLFSVNLHTTLVYL